MFLIGRKCPNCKSFLVYFIKKKKFPRILVKCHCGTFDLLSLMELYKIKGSEYKTYLFDLAFSRKFLSDAMSSGLIKKREKKSFSLTEKLERYVKSIERDLRCSFELFRLIDEVLSLR